MTVNKLHRILSEIIDRKQGRRNVCISKTTFTSALEGDGCTILLVEKAKLRSYRILDDDGDAKILSDGTECYQTGLVLTGNSHGEDME